MTQALTSIRIPTDRANQIRQLSEERNQTLSATIGQLLELARMKGEAKRGLPSIRINALKDGIVIQLADREAQGFSREEARVIAKHIRASIAGQSRVGRQAYMSRDQNGTALVYRLGVSIGFACPCDTKPKMLALDIASEFADLLERSIKRSATMV